MYQIISIHKILLKYLNTLQIGHNVNPNDILGPDHLANNIFCIHSKWNIWPHDSYKYTGEKTFKWL